MLLTETTYIPLCGGIYCLVTILDACQKQVLGYAMSESLEGDSVLEAIALLVKCHEISLRAKAVIDSD